MKTLRTLPLAVLAAFAVQAALGDDAQAQSLTALYQAARNYDAGYLAARLQNDANLAHADQATALLQPQVGLAVDASHSQANDSVPAINYGFDTQTVGVSASQPLYRPQNQATYDQSQKQIAQSQAQLAAAEQDLIVRVSQAYFDVLAAQDNLAFVTSQKAAVAEQLASAQRNFDVGDANVTEQREAQAGYDLVLAQEIAATNDLHVRQIVLDQLVGTPAAAPLPLVTPVQVPPLVPMDPDAWVQEAQQHHPAILQAQLALDVAVLETRKAEAGHKPTLDLVASYGYANNDGGSTLGPGTTRGAIGTIGVQFNLPLYTGHAVQNRVRETLSLEDKARADLSAAQRAVTQGTLTAYYGVLSGISQVRAYEAAERSSQSALDADTLGYEVGARVTMDVLNAQSQLYATKAKLAKARYDVLTGTLRLRQANGSLRSEDLDAINALVAQ